MTRKFFVTDDDDESLESYHRSRFRLVATTQQHEDVYDLAEARHLDRPIGMIGSVTYAIKAALGSGVLIAHVSFRMSGALVGVLTTPLLGLILGYCIYILITSAQVIYKRTHVPFMSYPDLGEAAVAIYPNKTVQKLAKPFRFLIDTVICVDIIGACACYHLVIAQTLKQILENIGLPNEIVESSPHLRIYIIGVLPICIVVTQIRKTSRLAPFSMIGNFVIILSVFHSIYYASANNPKTQGLVLATDFQGFIMYYGMTIFSMSWSGLVIFIESQMLEPERFHVVVAIGMTFIVVQEMVAGFFGYAAYLDKCEAPVTMNYPMRVWPHIMRVLIAVVIILTYAINFWVPFNMIYVYIRERVDPFAHMWWERTLRACLTCIVCLVALAFPDISKVSAFLGTLCISQMALIWPGLIYLLVLKLRPGYGRFKWKLMNGLFFLLIGIGMCIFGSISTFIELIR